MVRADILGLTIHELSQRIATRELAPTELIHVCFERASKLNDRLHGFISIQDKKKLLDEAKKCESEIKGGKIRSPLHGIPIGVKDGIAVAGVRNTAGSKILRDFTPEYDATVVHRLKEAGVIMFGKTNLHEFAWGATTTNPHFGAARNPWDESRIPGGSSGGSGAVVASGMVPAALGEDTGGSIRIPSSFCGLFGIRPTLGAVSSFGVVPLGYSFDTVGPMAKDPYDAGLILETISGRDDKDPATYSAASLKGLTAHLRPDVKGLRIGVPNEYFREGLVDDEVERNYMHSIGTLTRNGATTREITIPYRKYLQGVWYAITFVESSSFHEPWAKSRLSDYGDDVRALIEVGYALLGTHYVKAQRIRKMVVDAFLSLFKEVDVIATPTTAFTAPKIGQTMVRIKGEDYDFLDHVMLFTGTMSVTGLPCISIPNGLTRDHLPTAIQLIGRPFDEATLVNAGHVHEQEEKFHLRNPPP